MEEALNRLDEAYDVATVKKDYAKALEICNSVIKEYPSLVDGLRKRAAIYAHMGDLERAIADMTGVINLELEVPSNYFFRGWWHLDNGCPALSVDDLTRAIALGEEHNLHYHDQSAYFFRSAALLQLRRYAEALADIQHVDDDFLIFTKFAGKLTKADIVRAASTMP
jgi:tetratricopeptide (TPR) repeat protein